MVIYKTINIINGKIYVGQDSKNNPNYLGSGVILNKAINKYGKENFKKEILEECSTKEELNKQEIYWIKELNSQDNNIGYNIANGGYGYSGFIHTDEAKKKIRDASKGNKYALGHKHTNEAKERIKEKNRKRKNINIPVFQYDLDGNFIKEYYSNNEAARRTNIGISCINSCCRNERKTAGGFIWKYKDENNHKQRPKTTKKKISKGNKGKKRNIEIKKKTSKPVFQYDLDGNFIKEYYSIREANRITNIHTGTIIAVCKQERKTAGGFIWKYKDIYH